MIIWLKACVERLDNIQPSIWAANLDNICARKMRFYLSELKILWIEHVNNEEVLREIATLRNLMTLIKKKQQKFLEHTLRKESFADINTHRIIEDKRRIASKLLNEVL